MTVATPETPTAEPPAWYERTLPQFLLLAVGYPVGLILLLQNRRLTRARRLALGLLSLPIFVGLLLVPAHELFDFGGGATLSGFGCDFDRIAQYDRLERHRSAQASTSAAPRPGAAGLDDAHWTDFRGPHRDGVAREQGIATDWAAHPPREVYRQPVGEGYASFAVGHGLAFTIEQRREREAVVAYAVATGIETWVYDYRASFEEVLGGDGPRATPTLAGLRLYALGAEGDLHCLEAQTGKMIWRRDLLPSRADNLQWGLSGSPLVTQGLVVVTGSGKGGPSIVAYDAADGNEVWHTDVGVQGYSSPQMATLDGQRVLLNLAGKALNGLELRTGKRLWSVPWETMMDINVAQPIVIGDDRVFVASGYGVGGGLYRVSYDEGPWHTKPLWRTPRMRNKFSSSVYHNGHLYGLNERVLTCIDAESGERVWKGERYDYGSLMLVDGHLLVMSEDGDLALAAADPAGYEELGRVKVFDGRTWNNFIVIDGRLLARNHKQMVLYDLRPRDEAASH